MFKRNLSILIAAAGMALSLCACAGGKTRYSDYCTKYRVKVNEETSEAAHENQN